MGSVAEREQLERAAEIRRLVKERIETMTPQERDRIMQSNLAQARTDEQNARVMRDMLNFMIRMKMMRELEDQQP